MAQVIKKVGSLVPRDERYQKFVGTTDFVATDIIDIEASIGNAAREVTIVCGAGDSIEVRFNAQHTLYPEVNDNQFQGDRGGERRFDYDSPTLKLDETQSTVTVGNNETYVFDKTCRNIQVVALTANPEITVV